MKCYPKTQSIITTDESCSHDWVLQYTVGIDGTYGEIWTVCCSDNKNKTKITKHVMKYMPYNDEIRMNTREDILKEIDLQRRCGEVGLCPKVKEAWLCETGGAFVMDVYGLTVRELLLTYPNISDKQKILARKHRL